MYIKIPGWGNCWLSVTFVPGYQCSLLVTSAGGSTPAMSQPSATTLASQVHWVSSPRHLTSACQLSTPGPGGQGLASGLGSFAYNYGSQSILFYSPAGPGWQASGSSGHGQSEHVASEASGWFGVALQYMFARVGLAGLLGIWPLGDSYIGISQWGPSTVSSHVLELVYSPGNHFTGSSSGTN